MSAVAIESGYTGTMFTMTLNEIKQAIDARLESVDASAGDFVVRGINTDSRTIKQGELFIALKGENFDAHDFISHACNRGAAAYVLDHEIDGVKPALIVNDTRIALGKLASAWRKQFSYPFVAVTGSNGKTTVKEMLHSILATQGNVLATKGNFNNDIGVPLTLYRLTAEHDSAVIEMGANHQSEISYLAQLVRPDVAIITNAAAAHLEGFGSIDGVAKAKGEIFEGLNDHGVAILNYDDKQFNYWKGLVANKRVISFGIKDGADVSCIKNTENNKLIIRNSGSDKFELNLPLLGQHNVINALAAIAASVALDIDYKSIKKALESIKPVPGRLERKRGINDSIVIDDTYNANPASLSAAVDAVKDFAGENFNAKYHMVLGDMGELGDNAISLHQNAAATLLKANVTNLYTLGSSSEYTSKEFLKHTDAAQHFSSHETLVTQLMPGINPGDIVLIKGSRSMQMEKIVNAICIEPSREGGK